MEPILQISSVQNPQVGFTRGPEEMLVLNIKYILRLRVGLEGNSQHKRVIPQ